MSSLSIKTRVVLVVTIATAAVSIIAGWISVEVAGDAIEKRSTIDMTHNASSMIAKLNLSPNDGVMEHLSRIFGAEIGVMSPARGQLLASSLEGKQRKNCEKQLSKNPAEDEITLDGNTYRIGAETVPYEKPLPGHQQSLRLYLLLPVEQIHAARKRAARQIIFATLPVTVAFIVFAALLSLTITRPITRLSKQAEKLSREILQKQDAANLETTAFSTSHGPLEVKRLSKSFDHLVENLRIANNELTETRRMADIGRLAASAAHELKNPLSGIKMNARILLDLIKNEDNSHQLIKTIFAEIERMDIYLRELTYLAKDAFENEDQLFKPENIETVSIVDVMEECAKIMSSRLAHVGIELEKNYSTQTTVVSVDKTQIQQVVINLMINAMETNNAGGQIRISAYPARASQVAVSISDNGGGVKVSGNEDIFSPFVTTRQEGAGLGLHICKKIIESHGGKIWYTNTSRGAKFHFTLPYLADKT